MRRPYIFLLEEDKAIIRRLVETFNKHDVASLDDLMAPDIIIDDTLRGLENFKQFETMFIKGFPDYSETIEDIIAEGDKVWTRSTVTGTHKGEYRGVSPTGKEITIRCVDIYRIVDGKILEAWEVYDLLTFYKQLGVIEYKGFPDEAT